MTIDQADLPIGGQRCQDMREDVLIEKIAQRLLRESNAVPGVCQICGATLAVSLRVAHSMGKRKGTVEEFAPGSDELEGFLQEVETNGGFNWDRDGMVPMPVCGCDRALRNDYWDRANQLNADRKRALAKKRAEEAGEEYKPQHHGLHTF